MSVAIVFGVGSLLILVCFKNRKKLNKFQQVVERKKENEKFLKDDKDCEFCQVNSNGIHSYY